MIERVVARVLLVEPTGRVLLFRGSDPAAPQAGAWWITPGGGVEAGESLVEAARREVWEETGRELPADLGPVLLVRPVRFTFEQVEYVQTEHFFRVPVTDTAVHDGGWTEVERRTLHAHRWWSADELAGTTDTVYPEGLADLLAGDPPGATPR